MKGPDGSRVQALVDAFISLGKTSSDLGSCLSLGQGVKSDHEQLKVEEEMTGKEMWEQHPSDPEKVVSGCNRQCVWCRVRVVQVATWAPSLVLEGTAGRASGWTGHGGAAGVDAGAVLREEGAASCPGQGRTGQDRWGGLGETRDKQRCYIAVCWRQEAGERGFRAGLILLLFLVASKANGAPLGAGGGSSQKTPLFETYSDWDREVKRTSASGWRVCSINEGYMISTWWVCSCRVLTAGVFLGVVVRLCHHW